MNIEKQIEGWRDEAQRQAALASGARPAAQYEREAFAYSRVLAALPEVLAEGWATPDERGIDEWGNEHFIVYLSGRHTESDRPIIILKGDGELRPEEEGDE